MVVTEIDYFAIKERIVAILKNDTGLFPATGKRHVDKTVFRKIEAGAPDFNKIAGPYPRMWVTNDDAVDVDRRIVNTASDEINGTIHTLKFLIIFVVDGKDGPKAEENSDDFTKLIKEVIKENYRFEDPANPNTDDLVDRAWPERVDTLNRDLVGSNILGRVISVECTRRSV